MNDTLSIDKNLKTFIDIVLWIHSYSFPITRLPRKKIEAPWINRHIQKMISTKRHLLKRINKYNKSSDKIELHTVNKRFKKTIWQSRNNYYTNRFFSLTSNEKWKEINFLTNKKQDRKTDNVKVDAETFGTYLSNIFS